MLQRTDFGKRERDVRRGQWLVRGGQMLDRMGQMLVTGGQMLDRRGQMLVTGGHMLGRGELKCVCSPDVLQYVGSLKAWRAT
jgi:hypothetical protein